MSEAPIYHIAMGADWEAAKRSGFYQGPLGKGEEFLHFSSRSQIEESAAKHRAGIEGLVLLEVESSALGDNLVWEPSRGGALFPHLYGPLPLSAVLRNWDLPLDDQGQHRFPRTDLPLA